MYVDRYRFANEPEKCRVASQPLWRDLVSDYRFKARSIIGLLADIKPVIAGYRSLTDAESRRLFWDILIYRHLTPHLSRIANNVQMYRKLEEVMGSELSSEPLDTDLTELNEKPRLWKIAYKSTSIKFKSTKYVIYELLESNQYHFRRGNISIGPEPGDIVLDCGCYTGDSAVPFAIDVGAAGMVYAFDPSRLHIAWALDNVISNGLGDRVALFECGVSNSSSVDVLQAVINPQDGVGSTGDNLNAGRPLTAVDRTITIDDFCSSKSITRVDYIKMDVEGSEAEALEGADKTIRKHRPKLAVCVYHLPSDLWQIPKALKALYPFYDIYLDHHSLHLEETVLYAQSSSSRTDR